jgi:hypothetical protein
MIKKFLKWFEGSFESDRANEPAPADPFTVVQSRNDLNDYVHVISYQGRKVATYIHDFRGEEARLVFPDGSDEYVDIKSDVLDSVLISTDPPRRTLTVAQPLRERLLKRLSRS